LRECELTGRANSLIVFLGDDEITCARSGLLVQVPPCSAQLGSTHPDVVRASRQGVEGAFTMGGLNFPASRLGSLNYNGILIILLHPVAARLFFSVHGLHLCEPTSATFRDDSFFF
jgi:hypothetical protein